MATNNNVINMLSYHELVLFTLCVECSSFKSGWSFNCFYVIKLKLQCGTRNSCMRGKMNSYYYLNNLFASCMYTSLSSTARNKKKSSSHEIKFVFLELLAKVDCADVIRSEGKKNFPSSELSRYFSSFPFESLVCNGLRK